MNTLTVPAMATHIHCFFAFFFMPGFIAVHHRSLLDVGVRLLHYRLQCRTDEAFALTDKTHRQVNAIKVLQQALHQPLGQPIPARERADQRQQSRPNPFTGDIGGQHRFMLLAANLADLCIKPIFRDVRFDLWNVDRLMTPVQACGSDLATTFTLLLLITVLILGVRATAVWSGLAQSASSKKIL